MNAHSHMSLNAGGRLLSLDVPQVMGILNVTPDSFYAGSRKQAEADIAARANEIVEQGGTIIDIGAFSTRPGAARVSEAEEADRLRHGLAVVRREQPGAIISVDTFRADVARMAVEEYGVAIINDVSGGNPDGAFGGAETNDDGYRTWTEDDAPPIFRMAARLGVPYILMSSRPDTASILMEGAAKSQLLHSLGVNDVILDPGFGFGKTTADNYAIMAGLDKLHSLGLPLLVGISRKSMITRLLGCTTDEALNGTTALNTAALMKGAHILRVHDIGQAAECVKIVQALKAHAGQAAPAANDIH